MAAQDRTQTHTPDIPAHALMYAAYMGVLDHGGDDPTSFRVAAVGFCAGSVSTLCRDAITVPAETVKQRLRLGYYRDAAHATRPTVERDGNMPPKHLVMTVTEEGKAMGKEKLEKTIVEALKDASDKSEVGRGEAQKGMMKYISESMKKMGAM